MNLRIVIKIVKMKRLFFILIFLSGCLSVPKPSNSQDMFSYFFEIDGKPAWQYWQGIQDKVPLMIEAWYVIRDDSIDIKQAMTIPNKKEWNRDRYVDIISLKGDDVPLFGFQTSYTVDDSGDIVEADIFEYVELASPAKFFRLRRTEKGKYDVFEVDEKGKEKFVKKHNKTAEEILKEKFKSEKKVKDKVKKKFKDKRKKKKNG